MVEHKAIARLARTLLSVVCFASGCDAWADDFFAGKRITIVVGFGPGGGIDAYARLLAQHLGKHVPGQPSVGVVNMPGAAGLTAVMAMQNTLPPDGTTIVAFNPALVVQSILTPQKFRVNFAEANWLGSADGDLRICYMWAATGVKTWDEFKRRDPVIMADSGGGDSAIEQKILRNIFGVKIKQVLGYAGSSEKQLAVERGEVDGDCGAWTGTPTNWIRDRKINFVMRFQDETAVGLPGDVPYSGDLVTDPKQKSILDLLTAGSDIGRPYLMSKAVPTDRLAALRTAFDATMSDVAFRNDGKSRQLTIHPTSGLELQEKVQRLQSLPPTIVDEARHIMQD